ncbi:MAG: MerR family transcriptional regulator [Myxococcales bacterium]
MTAPSDLSALVERDDLTLEELISLANDWLARLAPRQTRYKVTERPDIRTVRYYMREGLLPKPVSYAGGRARFSGRHLVRLLSLKRLQAEHHTLQRIKVLLDALSDEELLRALANEAAVPAPSAVAPPAAHAPQLVARFELLPGVTLHVPAASIDDPARRRALAKALEDFARKLLAGDGSHEKGGGK